FKNIYASSEDVRYRIEMDGRVVGSGAIVPKLYRAPADAVLDKYHESLGVKSGLTLVWLGSADETTR
ncbi:MAG: hypothetical protein LBI17_03155, partial [Rickettsiales bacterium]|nr:hypothetical protein [Rickettsiales bacterium]